MATITLTRQGKHQVQIRLKGVAPVIRSFDSRAAASKWGEKEENRLKRERSFGSSFPIKEKTTKCDITLGQLIERYITEVTSNRGTLRAINNQTYELKAFVREPICGKLLSDLSVEDFNAYVLKRIKTLNRRTVKRQIGVVRNALGVAKKIWKYPADPDWIKDLGFKAKLVGRQRRLAEGEYDRLMQACDEIRPPRKLEDKITPRIMKLVIQVALLTSMRREELLIMRWDNVRFKEHYIHVPKTKTTAKRDIPLLPEAAKLLAAFHPERISNELVFPFHFEAFKSAWRYCKTRAGVVGLTFHDLRHEALSRLSEQGVTPVELMLFSGHTSLTQLSIYVHGTRKNVLSRFENDKSLLT